MTWDGTQAPEPWQGPADDSDPITAPERFAYGCGWALSIVGLLAGAGLLITGLAYWADQLLGVVR